MTTIVLALLGIMVGIALLVVGFVMGVFAVGYSQKVRNEEAGRKLIEQWQRQARPPETEARVQ